jgi:hypothetical protein
VQAENAWVAAAEKSTMMLTRLALYPEAQVKHALLRSSLDACRVMHLLRSTPLQSGAMAVADLSARIRATTDDFVGGGLTSEAWDQCRLPMRFGGLGIADPEFVRPTARIAAVAGFVCNAKEKVGLPIDPCQGLLREWDGVLRAVRVQTGSIAEPVATWVSDPVKSLMELSTAEFNHTKQSWWAEQVTEVTQQRMTSGGSVRDQVRRQHQQGPISNAWMEVVPNSDLCTDIPNSEYVILCRFWLGLPLLHGACARYCPPCPECGHPCDAFGDH